MPASMQKNKLFFSGTSGLVVPVPKSQYPEEHRGKSRLGYYATLFNSIEINSIFYKLPKQSTINNWVEAVPPGFRFTFKLSKAITHVKSLKFFHKDVDAFMNTISPAVNNKGCLLVQFPPGLKIECFEQMESLLSYLNEINQEQLWPIAVEFRNQTWDHPEVFNLLEEYKMTSVIHDLKGSAPLTSTTKSGVRYLRFHGPEGTYRGSYELEWLEEYAGFIEAWLKKKQTVFVYFNNTMGEALANLQTLNKLIFQE
jgi:uncharacterized protein YecE (DUF72 family)